MEGIATAFTSSSWVVQELIEREIDLWISGLWVSDEERLKKHYWFTEIHHP